MVQAMVLALMLPASIGCGGPARDPVTPAIEQPARTPAAEAADAESAEAAAAKSAEPAAAESAEPPQPVETIGVATMLPDGTIVLKLRADAASGARGEAVLTYRPGDPNYPGVRAHVGPIVPGQTIPVKPWPEEP